VLRKHRKKIEEKVRMSVSKLKEMPTTINEEQEEINSEALDLREDYSVGPFSLIQDD